MNRPIATTAAFMLLALCAGCTATGARFNFAPLIDYELDRQDGSVNFSMLGPIIHYEEQPGSSLFAVRPLVSVYGSDPDEKSDVHVIYPLTVHQKRGANERFTILPVYNGQTRYDPAGRRDSDYLLFPILWIGSGDEPQDRYFAVFPVYGTIKGILGLDRIFFVFFPVYAETTYGKRERTHVLWPFFAATDTSKEEGGGRSARLWPFYGQIEKKGKYSNRFVLWPIYTEAESGLDTQYPAKGFSVFPFYAEQTSARMRNRTYILFFSFGRDERTHYESVSFPWPLVVFETSDNHTLKRVWPFWSHYSEEGLDNYSYVFPLVWSQYQSKDDWKKESLWVLPFFWKHRKAYNDSGQYELSTTVWPLMRHGRDKDGTGRTKALYILPFEDPDGFGRDWSPLWEIFTSVDRPASVSQTDVLWGFFRHRCDGEKSFTDVTPIFSYNSAPDGGGFSILQGLFGLQTGESGTQVRLFWFIGI